MKKINLKGISEILSEKELKNVMGGSGSSDCSNNACGTGEIKCCLPEYNWCVKGFCKAR